MCNPAVPQKKGYGLMMNFSEYINTLIKGEHLGQAECRHCFNQILTNEGSDHDQGAFLAALRAKGETVEEIAGAWQSVDGVDTVHVCGEMPADIVENSGTGMDPMKTVNISSGAAVIAAAGGVAMARHGSRALSSRCGTVDVCEVLGIDVDCSVESVAASIRQCGIGLFNGMSSHVHPEALARLLGNISFGSPLNIAASLAHPARPEIAVRGVHHPGAIEPVANVMHAIGYHHALIIHGCDGDGRPAMDELSIYGPTYAAWLYPDGIVERFEISPEDFGIEGKTPDSIRSTGDIMRDAAQLHAALRNEGNQELINTLCLNAAAIFIIAGKYPTLQAGFDRAKALVGSMQAAAKLDQWIRTQGRT